jgi:hypothetical protein
MFKSLAKDLSGTADICTTLTDLRKSLANDYLLPGEQVLFSFQSAKEEFAFTNEALITVKGENATTTRKLVRRYAWRNYLVTYVQFETTGRVDRDCEIKFMIGKEDEISIDIAKKEEQAVKKYYKALLALQREQEKRRYDLSFSSVGMKNVAATVRMDGLRLTDAEPAAPTPEAFGPLGSQASHVLQYLQRDFEKLNSRCYRDVLVAALR